MRKKIALVLTTMLIMTALLTTSYLTLPATAPEEPSPGPGPVYHWKIMLAQRYCNAWIEGVLTFQGTPIIGTEFFLECICDLPEPQPLGQFVFWKVPTDVVPTDIEYIKYIDIDKDGTPDIVEPISGLLDFDDPQEPHTWYQHLEEGPGPFGPWMVVVEVREQPYDEERPFFEWQIMMKTHGVQASLLGTLTRNDLPLEGTEFSLKTVGVDPDLQCQVVQTPYCTVPNDIYAELEINATPPPIVIDMLITQFPWTYKWEPEPGVSVELEVTEVQMHHYVVMEGWLNSGGVLGGNPPWDLSGWQIGDGVPFATRAPRVMPLLEGQDTTFTQRDPITGIVKLGIPAESYSGLDHMWYSYDVGTWFRANIILETQGCGWLFTGVGKDPILGAVDLEVFNNLTGVYTFGPDGVDGTQDDELLAGPTSVEGYAAGAGPPIGPCLQELRGPDNIPGTPDDPIGRGDPDGPNLPGSAIMYLPTTMVVTFWSGGQWNLLYTSPWPQLLTTGRAYDKVIEPASPINGLEATQEGHPWEFFAGVDHSEYDPVPWKDKYCNAYVKYASAWSVLNVQTPMGRNDVISEVHEKSVREDLVIADINCDELVDIVDIVMCALAFGAEDEYVGPDGIPMTGDDKQVADPNYDARGDIADSRGLIDIVDIVRIAINFGWQLTPNGIIKP
jgi:hypothetical protein